MESATIWALLGSSQDLCCWPRAGYAGSAPGCAPHAGNREWWWRYGERKLIVPGGEAGGVVGRTLLAELLVREARAVDRFLAAASRHPEWDEASFFLPRAYCLTAAKLDAVRRGVERCSNRLKQWRYLATRYEKRALNYRAMVVLASIVLWLEQ